MKLVKGYDFDTPDKFSRKIDQEGGSFQWQT